MDLLDCANSYLAQLQMQPARTFDQFGMVLQQIIALNLSRNQVNSIELQCRQLQQNHAQNNMYDQEYNKFSQTDRYRFERYTQRLFNQTINYKIVNPLQNLNFYIEQLRVILRENYVKQKEIEYQLFFMANDIFPGKFEFDAANQHHFEGEASCDEYLNQFKLSSKNNDNQDYIYIVPIQKINTLFVMLKQEYCQQLPITQRYIYQRTIRSQLNLKQGGGKLLPLEKQLSALLVETLCIKEQAIRDPFTYCTSFIEEIRQVKLENANIVGYVFQACHVLSFQNVDAFLSYNSLQVQYQTKHTLPQHIVRRFVNGNKHIKGNKKIFYRMLACFYSLHNDVYNPQFQEDIYCFNSYVCLFRQYFSQQYCQLCQKGDVYIKYPISLFDKLIHFLNNIRHQFEVPVDEQADDLVLKCKLQFQCDDVFSFFRSKRQYLGRFLANKENLGALLYCQDVLARDSHSIQRLRQQLCDALDVKEKQVKYPMSLLKLLLREFQM